ncbi:hypothetical protein [Agromyces mangrovi Wang et al. 2018]|uniref:hypothetical protein n=1 Tax=Agromyces mangrovi TaxID=1858653 RepID=UPI0025742585|nr:hypothetical protein [Agromyces mangrovi]BDZ64550.1 hypothetical protein GCM10025877_14880 [Agromyces mangrovi]
MSTATTQRSGTRAVADALRSWPALGALGAGLVLLALGAGAGGAPGIAMAGLGVAALAQGVAALRAGRVVLPRTTLGVVAAYLVVAAGISAAGLLPGIGVAGGPLVAASALAVVPAAAAAHRLRAPLQVPGSSAGRRSTVERWPSLVGLVAGAVLVAGLVTPALAATTAGEHAVPHGELHTEHVGH